MSLDRQLIHHSFGRQGEHLKHLHMVDAPMEVLAKLVLLDRLFQRRIGQSHVIARVVWERGEDRSVWGVWVGLN